jgi:hypothetical protein
LKAVCSGSIPRPQSAIETRTKVGSSEKCSARLPRELSKALAADTVTVVFGGEKTLVLDSLTQCRLPGTHRLSGKDAVKRHNRPYFKRCVGRTRILQTQIDVEQRE